MTCFSQLLMEYMLSEANGRFSSGCGEFIEEINVDGGYLRVRLIEGL
jgi:hypothetical protein